MLRIEHGSQNEIPIITDPKSFLEVPHRWLEVGKLDAPPTQDLVQFLPKLKYEVGMILLSDDWYVIKAGDVIPSWIMMPYHSDVLLRSSPIMEDEENNPCSIPSMRDLMNSSPSATDLIASGQGLTKYGPVSNQARRDLKIE